MATDNSPSTYIYLSQRLLRERYQQHVAHQWDHRVAPQFRPPLFTFGLDQREDPDNPFWLARRVTDAVHDLTGSLTYPGDYVRAEMPITWSVVPVADTGYRVAWLSGISEEPEGKAFVALVGSLRNYIGFSYPEMDRGLRGWFPSSAEGLRGILNSFSDKEADPELGYLEPEEREPEKLVRTAYRISSALGGGYRIGSADLELLFQVLDYVPGVNLQGSTRVQVAHIGTPLWARTAARSAFDSRFGPSDQKVWELTTPGGDVVRPSARGSMWTRIRNAIHTRD